jgi:putative DNA primase/helicase
MRMKIKLDDGRFVNWYRVFADGVSVGWQAKKPDDYKPVPYVTSALDPFDSELIADEILWPEGEKDVDTLSKLNLAAFTFGGVGDGLPGGIGHYLKDRHLVILADNDEAGRKHADKKAALADEAVRPRSRLSTSPSCRRRAMFPISLSAAARRSSSRHE